MATEKVEAKETKRAADVLPEILGNESDHVFVSPHDLTEDVDPNYAGDYELIHGCVRIPQSDGKGGFTQRGKTYRKGAKLRLGALDAHRFLQAGVVKRIDGKRPDRVEKLEVADTAS